VYLCIKNPVCWRRDTADRAQAAKSGVRGIGI